MPDQFARRLATDPDEEISEALQRVTTAKAQGNLYEAGKAMARLQMLIAHRKQVLAVQLAATRHRLDETLTDLAIGQAFLDLEG